MRGNYTTHQCAACGRFFRPRLADPSQVSSTSRGSRPGKSRRAAAAAARRCPRKHHSHPSSVVAPRRARLRGSNCGRVRPLCLRPKVSKTATAHPHTFQESCSHGYVSLPFLCLLYQTYSSRSAPTLKNFDSTVMSTFAGATAHIFCEHRWTCKVKLLFEVQQNGIRRRFHDFSRQVFWIVWGGSHPRAPGVIQ